ncbi:activating signal cointegrator 1 complex subunit 2 homolog [Hyperolius riggenbachi]|uniref:activating signal cointegrator 1 complex subunit 2 homolog n=1 Tax=Hyperolius riggenbachi TaxID=752182 RepID=UPI0035A3BC65
MRDRWKAVKDNYKREIEKEKRAKSGSGPAYVSKYCHFQQLEFLRPTFDGRQTEDSFQIDALETESSHTQDGMSQMDTLEAAPSTSQNAPTGRKRSRELVGPGKNVDTNMFYAFQQLMERWKQSQEQMSPIQKLANSLVTYMEKVPEESLPFMHKEILDVIIKYQHNTSINSHSQDQHINTVCEDSQPPSIHSQHPSIHSQPPSIHSQHPSIHSQPPSIHSQPPSIHSQHSSIHSQPPSIHSQPPSAHSQHPSAHSQHPSIHSQPPSIHSQPPSIHSQPPSIHSQPPSAHSQHPSIHSQHPSIHSQPPSAHSQPLAKSYAATHPYGSSQQIHAQQRQLPYYKQNHPEHITQHYIPNNEHNQTQPHPQPFNSQMPSQTTSCIEETSSQESQFY